MSRWYLVKAYGRAGQLIWECLVQANTRSMAERRAKARKRREGWSPIFKPIHLCTIGYTRDVVDKGAKGPHTPDPQGKEEQ